MHVFERREKTGVPGENPRIHGESMQTPHRKALAGIQTRNPLAVRRRCQSPHNSVGLQISPFIQCQFKKSSRVKETNRLHRNVLSMHEVTVEIKKLPLNRKKSLAEPDSGRVNLCLNRLGVDRSGRREQQAP